MSIATTNVGIGDSQSNNVPRNLWGSIFKPTATGTDYSLKSLSLTNKSAATNCSINDFKGDSVATPTATDLAFTGSGAVTKYSDIVTNSAWRVAKIAGGSGSLSLTTPTGKVTLSSAGINSVIGGDGSVGVTYSGGGAGANADFILYYSNGTDGSSAAVTFNAQHP